MDIRQIAAALKIDISVASALMKNLATQGRISTSPDTSMKNKRGKAKTLYHIPVATMDSLRNLFGTTGELMTTEPAIKTQQLDKPALFKIELAPNAFISADVYQYILSVDNKKSYYSRIDDLLTAYMHQKVRTSNIENLNEVVEGMKTLYKAIAETFHELDPAGLHARKLTAEDEEIVDDVIDVEIEEEETGIMGMKRVKVPTSGNEDTL